MNALLVGGSHLIRNVSSMLLLLHSNVSPGLFTNPFLHVMVRVCLIHYFIGLPPGVGETAVMQLRF